MHAFFPILITAAQYGGGGNTNSSSMIQFQKRAAGIILDKNIDTPSSELFAELNWLKFPDRVDHQKAVLMYKIMNKLTPNYLKKTPSLHLRHPSLRSTTENLLYISKPNMELFRKYFVYSGSKIWNRIPDCI